MGLFLNIEPAFAGRQGTRNAESRSWAKIHHSKFPVRPGHPGGLVPCSEFISSLPILHKTAPGIFP